MTEIPDWAEYLAFRDAFAGILDNRFHTIEWLDFMVSSGAYRFWRSENAAIIAEVKIFPTGARQLHGLLAAGELAEIISCLIPQAEKWGREKGCVLAVIESRPGWAKALADYEIHQISVRKEL